MQSTHSTSNAVMQEILDEELYSAVERNDVKAVEAALLAGANPDFLNSSTSQKPLALACALGHYDCVDPLLRHGANPNGLGQRNKTPLLAALTSKNSSGGAECARRLIAVGAENYQRDWEDRGALHIAAAEGHTQILDLLVKSGANPFSTTKKGWSALHFAIQSGHTEIASYLIDLGLSAHQEDSDGLTPIALAVKLNHHVLLKNLTDREIQLNGKLKNGETLLCAAARAGESPVSGTRDLG